MAIGTAVAGEPGKHQPETIEQFRAGAEGAADSRNPGPLMEGQSRRDVQYLVHRSFGRLGHPAPGIGGKRFQVPPGPFRIQDPQGQGGFPGPGDPSDPHDFVEGNVHVDIFQVMHPGAPDLNVVRDGRDVFLAHTVRLLARS